MGDVTLDKVNALPDFLTDERFEIAFSKMPAVSGITSDEINLRTVTFKPPKATLAKVTATLHSFAKSQPAARQPEESITITLIETIDAKTFQFIKDWRDICVARNTHKVGNVSDREAELLVYHKDNQNRNVWNYKIIKAWLQDYDIPEFTDGSSPATVQSTITLAYSDFIDGKRV